MSKRLCKHVFIVLNIIILLTACQSNEANQRAYTSSEQPMYSAVQQKDAERMKTEVERMKEVDKVSAVQIEEEIYLTLKVSGFDRLFLERIKKGAYERAEKVNNKATVHISTDKKIDMELTKLEANVKKRTITKDEVKGKLKKLDKDMKG